MSENIFEITNLQSAYNGDNIVLQIDNLNIPEGKVVFFVGSSGIGKSTILETLGFMNKTIYSAEKFTYQGQDMRRAWEWSDSIISEFRNKNFSFIFQQTNLMPNFSSYENIMTTALFQGATKLEAVKRTVEVIKQMQLPTDDRPISQFSGGQQQRIAFARAILPQFNVLFGDEPTGNLDMHSAKNLMSVLANELHERKATAIIVSHDIYLAVEYADMIVLIRKQEKEFDSDSFYGVIDKDSIYMKENENWILGEELLSNIELKEQLLKNI